MGRAAVAAAQKGFEGGLAISVYFFITFHFDNHFYLAFFKAMFVKVLILAVAIVT